jgi:outer membrane biosynthesis protein TonB
VTVRGNVRARIFGLLAMSASTHVIVFSMLGLMPPPSRVLAMHEAQFEVVTPPPPPEPPKIKEPDPPKPPEPVKSAPRKIAAPQNTPPPPAQNTPPPAAAEEVADLTGMTLTGGDGASWSSVVGTGGALKGPIGKIGRAPVATQQAAKTGPVGPRFVSIDSLARKPQQPAGVDALLKRNFPRRAQLQGVEGAVVVMMRILPTGRVDNVRVIEEKPAGFEFAAACRQTLLQMPPFLPPLDRTGTAVATDAKFTCNFFVDAY